MRMVEFTKVMAPHGIGDTRVVPDEIADKLIREGVAKIRESVFDQIDPKAKPGAQPKPTKRKK